MTAETLRPFKYVDKQFRKMNPQRFEDPNDLQSSLPTNPTTADTLRLVLTMVRYGVVAQGLSGILYSTTES